MCRVVVVVVMYASGGSVLMYVSMGEGKGGGSL